MKKHFKYSLIGLIILVPIISILGFAIAFLNSGNELTGYDFNHNGIPDREEGYINREFADETIFVRNILKRYVSDLNSSFGGYVSECAQQNNLTITNNLYSEELLECEIEKNEKRQNSLAKLFMEASTCLYETTPENAKEMADDVRECFLSHELRSQVNSKIDSYLTGGLYTLPSTSSCEILGNYEREDRFFVPIFDRLSFMIASRMR